MKLTLTTTLGKSDRELLGLASADAAEGDAVDLDDKGAAYLTDRGWAVPAATAAPAPPLKADPPKSGRVEAVPPGSKPANA